MDSGKDVRETVIKYSDTLYKVCIVILCNEHDAQDAIQDTFCRYLEKKPEFRDEEHEKAWLIRVAANICRDMIRFRIRHPKVSIDEVENTLAAAESREKDARLEKMLEDAGGGISVEEAVEIARKQLQADFGGEADEMELLTYNDGTPGVCPLDASEYEGVAFAGESKAGVVYDVGFGNPDTHVIYGYVMDAVDGRILYSYQ